MEGDGLKKGGNKHPFKALRIYQSLKGKYERSMVLPVGNVMF